MPVLFEAPFESHRNGLWLLGTMCLEEGAKFCCIPNKKDMKIPSLGRISPASGRALFSSLILAGKPVTCFQCGATATHWIIEKFFSDGVKYPHLNLFAKNNEQKLVLMTQDHIIPRSRGGSNHLDNLRPACATCNHTRQSYMTSDELQFMHDNPQLIRKY